MNKSNFEPVGTVSVSSRALMQAVHHIVKKTDGIYALSDRSLHDTFHRLACGNFSSKGVYLTRTAVDVSVLVYVVCEADKNSGKLCRELSEKIKNEISENFGIVLRRVKILIHGIHRA